MKKRICFVGFAEAQLEVLKQAVSHISSTWDCTFVPSATAAQEAMASEVFDAVVATMRLPGMHGAEFLRQAGQTHPKTLRFIVGEVADQELIINCIGGTHQFIAEPCETHILISTIQRSLALDVWLSSEPLRAILPKLRRLPSLPSTYFEVLKQVESPHSSVQSVGEVIARDPAATARLLHMVNSAAFAFSEKITDPVQAVTLLGMETVKSLVLCLQVFSQDEVAKQAGVSFNQLWEHSFAVATTARQIALLQTSDPHMTYEAFTAGLLHDVGRIVMASNLPQEYAAVIAAAREHSRPLLDEEVAQLGVSHAQVGAYLLGVWGMPATVVEAAALHHSPNAAFAKEFSVLTAVHVADVLAHEQESGKDGLARPQLDAAYLNALGLADQTEVWRTNLGGGKPKPASSASSTRAKRPDVTAPKSASAATARRNNLLGWLLVPATAATVVGFLLFLSSNKSNSEGIIKVSARAASPSAPVTPAPIPVVASSQPAVLKEAEVRPTAAQPDEDPAVESANAQSPVAAPVQEDALPASSTSTNGRPLSAPEPLDDFASVKVQGIFYRTADPSVLINGKTLRVGDRINEVKVVAIERSSVTLALGEKRKVFVVK